ncbi:MAG: low specificity L-threonine aldolase, partial [Acidobacteriota bacterium]
FLYRRKRAGQLVSKSRYLGAQMLGYLDHDLWLDNARHANAMADLLATGVRALPHTRLPLAVEANEVFAIIPHAMHEALQSAGARYLVWPGEGTGTDNAGPDEVLVRWLTSFRTTPSEVRALLAAAANPHPPLRPRRVD